MSNSKCEKPTVSKFLIQNNTWYFDRNPRFLIKILDISIEILGISKICDNRIPFTCLCQQGSLTHGQSFMSVTYSIKEKGNYRSIRRTSTKLANSNAEFM